MAVVHDGVSISRAVRISTTGIVGRVGIRAAGCTRPAGERRCLHERCLFRDSSGAIPFTGTFATARRRQDASAPVRQSAVRPVRGHRHVVVVADACRSPQPPCGPPTASMIGCGGRRRKPPPQVVADQPDVVVDFPTTAIEFEPWVMTRSMAKPSWLLSPPNAIPCRQPSCERLLDTSSRPGAFGNEPLRRQPALQVKVDQRTESLSGRQSAIPRRIQRRQEEVEPAACPTACQVKEHPPAGSGEIGRRILVGFRSTDGVDHAESIRGSRRWPVN